MKVTEIPVQTGFAEAPIDTLTGRFGLTVTVSDGEGGTGIHPALAVSVKVAVPLYAGGGVQVAIPGVEPELFKKIPPAPPDVHTADVVPSRNAPPNPVVEPP